MNEPPFPATRLATMLAVSGCIHLLGLALLMRAHDVEVRTGASAAIAIRLLRPASPPAERAPAPPALRARPTPAVPVPAPLRPASLPAAPAPRPAAPAVPSIAVPDGTAAATTSGYLTLPPDMPVPPRYTMSWPAPNSLRFDSRSDDAAGNAAVGEASFSIAFGAETYSVSMGGAAASVDAAGHALSSEGTRLDDGFAPLRATISRNGLPETSWRLNRAHDPAAANAEQGEAGKVIVHDQASMLLQLMGMGLHDSTQLESPVQLAVAGAGGIALVTFEFAAVEMITVPYGTYEAWHLVQTSGPDASRLEVWFAPALGWYPLQLKTTAPSGAVVMQRLLRAEQALQVLQ